MFSADFATGEVKKTAAELGFDFCGISRAGFLEKEARNLEEWLNKGFHAGMSWMENHFDKRTNPKILMPGAKSVISFLINYYPESQGLSNQSPKISKYAYGEDYHLVIRDKMVEFVERLKEKIGEFEARVFVDSAPVMDKAWAAKSGLGWIGKNTNLIRPDAGSFFFLAEVICDLDLVPDGPIKDYCGTCTKCLDECPTGALFEPGKIDAGKCISYLTIELKDEMPKWASGQMNDWIFGCDICQDVCPWNRFSKSHKEARFMPLGSLTDMKNKDWKNLTEETFSDVFKKSAIKRTKYKGLLRNLKFITENKIQNPTD